MSDNDITMESDDDDDLVAPTFLQKPMRSINEVLTPRKGIRPSEPNLSPLTPVSLDSHKVARTGRAKFSLTSLLTEKEKTDEIQKKYENILQLRNLLDKEDFYKLPDDCDEENLELSQYSQSQDYEYSHDVSQDPFLYNNDSIDGKDLLKVSHQLQTGGNDFSDTIPGEKIFIFQSEPLDLQDILKLLIGHILGPDDDITDNDLKDENTKELLYDVLQSYIDTDFSENIFHCLWNLVVQCEDYKISQSSLHILINAFSTKNEMTWFPTVHTFFSSLATLGADYNTLLPKSFANNISKKSHSELKADGKQEFTDTRSLRKLFHGRLHNFISLIKSFTIFIQKHPFKFSVDDLTSLLIVVFKLSVERLVQIALWDLKVFIGTIIDAYSDTQWRDESDIICYMVASLDMHHRNVYHIAQAVPPTHRGMHFQSILSYTLAYKIITKKPINNNSLIKAPVEIKHIYNLVCHIHTTSETDFFELFSVISLIDLSLFANDITSSQKLNLKNLLYKLTSLNGEIKDNTGAFLNRTKVKDVILRLISYLTFAEQNLQRQSHLENYFEKNEGELKIERVKQTDSDDEDDSYQSNEEHGEEKRDDTKTCQENKNQSECTENFTTTDGLVHTEKFSERNIDEPTG